MKKFPILALMAMGLLYSCEKGIFSSLPKVETLPATIINATKVTLNGNVLDEGSSAVNIRGFCWGLTPNPTVNDNFSQNEFGPGAITYELKVIADTTYYFKAYATNSKGTSYGDELQFNTSTVLPILETLGIIEITSTSAQGGGNIKSDGGLSISARGICYSTNQNPTIASKKTTDGEGKGIFISTLTDLSPNRIYFVRAYATNSARTSYGSEISFKTLADLPIVTTKPITEIGKNSVIAGGVVTNDGGTDISDKGVCWAITPNPQITDNKASSGSGLGAYTLNLLNLKSNTTYYLRAYATNIMGTSYGEEVSFSTLEAFGNFTDSRDLNVYHWVSIGSQVWMAQNLAYLPTINPANSFSSNSAKYYVYNYDGNSMDEAKGQLNYSTYGVLYNYPSALSACPSGWHLPTDAEFKILEKFLGMSNVDADASGDYRNSGRIGQKLKETGTTHWISSSTTVTNETGFSALPGGYISEVAGFSGLTLSATFWSSTEAGTLSGITRNLNYNIDGMGRSSNFRSVSASIRCLRN
jgi:uncharacterized protein (TIGR02145 family)